MRVDRALPLVIALVAGCSRADTSAAPPPADSARGAPASVARAPMPLRSIDAADDAELARFRLTTDNVAKATLASRYIAELGATDPGLLQRLDQDSPLDNARTLQEAADRIAGVPRLRSAIERAGLSPREYILVSLTIARAAIANAYAVAGAAQSGAPELASANVGFVGAHQKDIQRYMEAVDAMTPSGGAGASER